MGTVTGDIQFSAPLLVQGDVLGIELPMILHDATGTISMPRTPKEWPRRSPLAHMGYYQSPGMEEPTHLWPDGYWGAPFQEPDCRGHVARAGVRFEVPMSSPMLDASGHPKQEMFTALYQWLSCVEDWLTLLTERPVDEPSSRVEPSTSIHLRSTGHDGAPRSSGGMVTIITPFDPIKEPTRGFVTLDLWKKAVESGSTPLPLEYKLLNAAFGALWLGNTRLAVLECATAIEVVLTAALIKQLAGHAPDFVAYLLKRHQELGRKASLCKLLKVTLPEGIESVVESRNRAIHAGVPPEHETAKKAVDVTKDVLHTHRPL